jgi:hypothetical protein
VIAQAAKKASGKEGDKKNVATFGPAAQLL